MDTVRRRPFRFRHRRFRAPYPAFSQFIRPRKAAHLG